MFLTFEDFDNGLVPLNQPEQEIREYLHWDQFQDRKEVFQAAVWWTARYGKITPEQYCPVDKMTSDEIYQELKTYWTRYAPLNMMKGDPVKAVRIAHVLIEKLESKTAPEKWLGKARTLLRAMRGSAPEWIWEDDPFTGQSMVYGRYRPGDWTVINE